VIFLWVTDAGPPKTRKHGLGAGFSLFGRYLKTVARKRKR